MRIFVIGLCITVGLIGCSTSTTEKNDEDLIRLETVWENEYAAWKMLNVQNYEFVVAIYNTGTHQKIIVKNGIYKSAISIHSCESEEPVYETIDSIFDKIKDDFFTEKKGIYPIGQIGTKFTVRYEPQYHYPIEYTRVYVYNKKTQMDGNGVTIEITEFVPLVE